MADAGKTAAQEAARLEAALDRIARTPSHGPPVGSSKATTADLARRLDALIAELRQVLGRDSAD